MDFAECRSIAMEAAPPGIALTEVIETSEYAYFEQISEQISEQVVIGGMMGVLVDKRTGVATQVMSAPGSPGFDIVMDMLPDDPDED